MDKLDLDARVLRLERRVGFLTMLLLGGLGIGILATLGLFTIRASEATPAATVFAPVSPPMPLPMLEEAAPVAVAAPMMGGMLADLEGSMFALRQELASMKQLVDEGVIDESEWEALKARALEKPLTPRDLRADLQAVQELFDTGAICDGERAELRAKLLGIDGE